VKLNLLRAAPSNQHDGNNRLSPQFFCQNQDWRVRWRGVKRLTGAGAIGDTDERAGVIFRVGLFL
jgi:hypothetical protein